MLLPRKLMHIGEIRSASRVLGINTNNHKLKQEMFIGIPTKILIKTYLLSETYCHLKKTKILLCCSNVLF